MDKRGKKIRFFLHVKAMLFSFRLIGIVGCGYQFYARGEHIDPQIQKVFVKTFLNRTSEPYLETYIQNAFVDRFIRGNRFKIAESPEAADAILRGNIKNFSTSPLAYGDNDLVTEERINITMEIIFEERDTKKVIWANKSFSKSEDCLLSETSQSANQTSHKNAIAKLSNDIAERAYQFIMSGF
jgi:hypothetical protein